LPVVTRVKVIWVVSGVMVMSVGITQAAGVITVIRAGYYAVGVITVIRVGYSGCWRYYGD
jgi:hypothetical protein